MAFLIFVLVVMWVLASVLVIRIRKEVESTNTIISELREKNEKAIADLDKRIKSCEEKAGELDRKLDDAIRLFQKNEEEIKSAAKPAPSVRKVYTDEFKRECVDYYKTHNESRTSVARRFGVPESTMRYWK